MKKEVVCPRCHSDQITSNKKGFSTSDILLKGLVLGASEANSVVITCLLCGARFQPGTGAVKVTRDDGATFISDPFKVDQAELKNKNKTTYLIAAGVILFMIVVVALSKL
jgi:hypothetical protein